MGRRRTINRESVLDAAESVVAEHGAGALTIGAVAEAAGVTKGGVQSCFGTKEALIAAMLDRWLGEDEARFEALAGPDPSPLDRIKAHVGATRGYDDHAKRRVASLLATLLQQPHHVEAARGWYERRLDGLRPDGEQGRRARLAFLATEGLFYLRFLGLLAVSSEEWQAAFTDIERLVDEEA